jgi:soluble lytic murein transglycosylase-like protein
VEITEELTALHRRMDRISRGPLTLEPRFGAIVDAALGQSIREMPPERPSATRSEIDRIVSESGADNHVDPALIEAIIENESGYDTAATSAAGARGLMQLMPETAAGLAVSDPYDVRENVRAGTRYLRSLLDRFGNLELAIAAYNAGPGSVERYGGVPPYAQTRSYVHNVLASYRRRSQLGNLATNEGSQRSASIVL